MSRKKCGNQGCTFDCYIQYSWNGDVLKKAQEAKAGSADSGICEHCVSGEQKKYSGAGKEIKIGELNAYINGPDGAKSAVIVNHDLFGWTSPNVRAIVDKVAGAGHLVVAADLYRGMEWTHGNDFSPANLGAFFAANPDERVQADILKLCGYFQKKKITQIGIMGFCWGGRQAFNASVNGVVKAAVSFHGGGVSETTCKDVKCPIFIIQASLDNYPPMATVETIKKTLEGMKKEVQLKVFPDVNHGFGIRADSKDKHAVKQAELALQDAMDFLAKKLCKL
jgi:carboxymethylenebutenolidase